MTRSSALRSDLVDLGKTAAMTEAASGDPTARPAIVGVELVGYEEATPIWRQGEKRWVVGLGSKSLPTKHPIPKEAGIDALASAGKGLGPYKKRAATGFSDPVVHSESGGCGAEKEVATRDMDQNSAP
jgi:hypothetical protein